MASLELAWWRTVTPRWKAMAFSVCVSGVLIATTKSPWGDLLHRFTDHFHHTRATWTFLNLGLEVYVRPFEETGHQVPYPHGGISWGVFPIAYPPGMFVVFLPLALMGRYVPLSEPVYGKLCVIYVTVFMHAALYALMVLTRRLTSPAWMVIMAMIWIFAIRASLLGFYDGTWFLAGVLGAIALTRGRPAWALIAFAVAAWLSYRAACLAPFGVVALVQMLRDPQISGRTKAGASSIAAVLCGTSLLAFWILLRYSPASGAEGVPGAGSSLLPISAVGYRLVAAGIAFAAALVRPAGWLVALTVALSSVLTILHAGHAWHGFICLAPVLAMGMRTSVSTFGQCAVGVWLALFWYVGYDYAPFTWAQELYLFIVNHGRYPN